MVGRVFELILHSVLVIKEPGLMKYLDGVLIIIMKEHREGRVSNVSFLDKVMP